MKKTLHILFATLAATVALVGCTKEITPPNFENDKVNPATEGSRIIAVSFAPQTKTALNEDGLTPKFIGKEMIKVSNGTECKDCEVKVDDEGNATFTTDLEGPLKAVYPSTAAKMNGNKIEGVLVSSVQSGTFASANICMAENITDKAVFENKTAVLRFYVGSEIEVTSVTLESLSESFAPNIGTKITVNAPAGKTLYDQMPDNQDKRVCYVAIPNGTFSQLTITTTAETQTPEAKMLTNCNLAAGSMYTVFIPYYIEVNDQKWAYCNIGAFLPEEPGLYFAWGETQGHWLNAKSDDHSFTKDTYDHQAAAIDADIKLDSGHDAARENWGEKWRMPMFEEYSPLATTDFEWSDISSGKWGLNYTQDGKSLYFPPTGYIEDSSRKNPRVLYYLSSTINTDNKDSVYVWCSDESALISRYHGIPIRPIYGSAPESTVEDLTVKDEDTDNWQ